MKMLVVLFAALSLMACSKDNSNSSSSAPANESRELVQKPELTKDQSEEIKTIMSKASIMPDTQLILGSANESDSSRQEREAKIKKLSSESKQVFDKLQDSCEISKPKQTVTGDQEKTGSKESKKVVAAIAGDKCPIVSKESRVIDTEVLERTISSKGTSEETQVVKTKSSGTTSSAMKIVAQDLQTQVGYKEMTSESTDSGTLEYSTPEKLMWTSKNLSNSTVVTVKDQKLKSRMLVEFTLKEQDQIEFYIRIDMDFPSSSPTIQSIQKAGEKEPTLYLNGKKMTAEQMKDLFGFSFGNLVVRTTKSEAAKQVLKVDTKIGL